MSAVSPIFIHSLFRAGSTYLFTCFRRSPAGYWCYQEPFHEFLANASTQPEELLKDPRVTTSHLRHPKLTRPYFYEFYPLAEQIGLTYRAEFAHANYFANTPEAVEPLSIYLSVLARGAQEQPVFLECRSAGRVASIRECLRGLHIFLWRNPWDQWWSYKVDPYFDYFNRQILASPSAPELFAGLRKLLGFDPANDVPESIVAQPLDSAGSYMLFFAIWCHAMLEGLPHCDFEINIDSLSSDTAYAAETVARLEVARVSGIDLSDCKVPIGIYGQRDSAFFEELEPRIINLLLTHGYSHAAIERMLHMREQHDPRARVDKQAIYETGAEHDRLRQVSRRLETEFSRVQREAGRLRKVCHAKHLECISLQAAMSTKETERQAVASKLVSKEAERQSLVSALDAKEVERRSLVSAVDAKEIERQSLELGLHAKEAERQSLEAALHAKEAELSRIESSRYWRWGRPIRMAEARILGLLHRRQSKKHVSS